MKLSQKLQSAFANGLTGRNIIGICTGVTGDPPEILRGQGVQYCPKKADHD
jgi:hypothetical protein